jgi:hypothetical protein
VRDKMRIRWWDRAANTYARAYIGPPGAVIADLPIDSQLMIDEPDRPVFIGHYWFTGTPAPAAAQVVCVDYSAGKGGPLVAYRFDGEPTPDASRFVAVGA